MKHGIYWILLFCLLACTKITPDPAVAELPTPEPVRYTVVLDFGHGGFDGGASGTETGVIEADLNLAVGKRVEKVLTEAGCRVILTRQDEQALGATKREDMQARGEILRSPEADCTVSIHMNKFRDRKVRGPMTFYQAGAEDGQRLAQCVMDALCEALEKPTRSANPANNFVTRIPIAPSVLVECGFLSNASDEQKLQDPVYQQTLADAVAKGVLRFLEGDTDPAQTESP